MYNADWLPSQSNLTQIRYTKYANYFFVKCICLTSTHVLGVLLKGSGVSGMANVSPVAPDIIRLSRLSRESLYEVLYEADLALLGVAATRTEKYFSCSRLDVVSPLWDAGKEIKPWIHFF